MRVRIARKIPVPSRAFRAGSCGGLAALIVFFGAETLQNATANGDTRTISFHHIHLKEDTTITYKVNGRYDPEGMKKVNWALRDWRTSEPTTMDPHLIDALWEVHREVGASEPIHVIGGYRTPATNAMLRRRSSGVAKSSQHMRGHAIDFFIPDVKLEAIREAGLRLQRGGVGFYPSSGAPFIHMDTGSVRHWPRMPEAQLAKVLAKGPLTQVAANTRSRATAQSRSTAPAPAAPAPEVQAPVVVASAIPLPTARPAAKPAVASASSSFELASATSRPVRTPPRPAQTASLVAQTDSANAIINERGYWQGLVEPTAAPAAAQAITVAARTEEPAPRPPAHIPEFNGDMATGSVAPWPTPEQSTTGAALAYAPATEPASTRINAPGKARVIARVAPAPERDTTVAVKPSTSRPSAAPAPAPSARVAAVKVGDRINDPWMRAMIVAPNALDFMSTSLYGPPDIQNLKPYLQKPAASVMMTFADDPHLGMTSDQFKGNAVVFVATVTFNRRTAALR